MTQSAPRRHHPQGIGRAAADRPVEVEEPRKPSVAVAVPQVRRLTVGRADDPLEREAEEAARRVVADVHGGTAAEPIVLSADRGELPRAVDPSAAATREGGPAGADVEREIEGARGSGRPLEPGLRSRLERSFHADLGAVRLHSGPSAAGLTRRLGAQAFTTGADIFLQRPDPGVELLGHEVAHVVQQRAGGADAARRAVRRLIGFEFEADSIHAVKLTRPLTVPEQTTPAATRTVPIADVEPYKKKDVLSLGHGVRLEADEDMNNRDALNRVRSDIEFVTEAFSEDKTGLKRWRAAAKDMTRMHDRLAQLPANNNPRKYAWPEEMNGLHFAPDTLIEAYGGAFSVKMQATAGIRLEAVPAILEQLGEVPAGVHESNKTSRNRQLGRDSVLPQLRFQAIAQKMGQAPGKVDQGLAAFKAAFAATTANADNDVINIGDTAALRGLLTLLTLQLDIYDTLAMGPYLKAMAPIMPRTNFAGMFNLLPTNQRMLFRKLGCARWLDLIGRIVPTVNLNNPVIANPNPNWNLALNRDDWLRDITNNADRLTERWQKAQVDLAHPLRPMRPAEQQTYDTEVTQTGYLEGQGSFGLNTEAVGDDDAQAPLMEFRTIMKDAANSTLPLDEAIELADQIYRWIVRLNRGKTKAVGQK